MDAGAGGRAIARSEGVTRIVASPLLRAQQTAAPLAEALAMAIETIEGWAEADRKAAQVPGPKCRSTTP